MAKKEKSTLEELMWSELFETVQRDIHVKRNTLIQQFSRRGMVESGEFVREIVNLEISGFKKLLEGSLNILLRVYFNDKKPRDNNDEAFLVDRIRGLYEHRLVASRTSLQDFFRSTREKKICFPIFQSEASKVLSEIVRRIKIIVRENRLNFPELPDRDTTELVGLNESTQLEFKSTFQWDMKESRKNERLRIEAIKTIAAFNNTNGGYLLIGVTDKKKICGIDKDLALLSRKDVDGFSQLLIQEIENEIDRSFATKPIITFPMIEDKQICLIKINPGQEATWVIVNGKSTFYIRTMNSTRELDPKKASEYILKKWGR